MSERVIVELSLSPGSLEELLAGPVCSRHYLTPDPDRPGAYRIHAIVPGEGDASTTAYLRVLSSMAPDPLAPALPPASPEVEDFEGRWREWIDSLPPA